MTATRIDLLRRMAAFGAMTNASLEVILAESAAVQLKQGEYFFQEGEPGDSLFVLEAGDVVVLRNWEGEPVVLGTLHQGDCFGEMSLIDFQKRSASVQASSDCRAIQVPSSALRSLFKQNLEQYAVLMMNLGREVSRRLRMADDRLFELNQFRETQHPQAY